MNTSEQEERRKLVGHCDKCQEWYKFTYRHHGAPEHSCPVCGSNPSYRHGYQPTTQRTFNPKAKKLSKSQLKKMSLGA